MPTDTAAARTAYDAWHGELPAEAGAEAPWHRLVREHLDPDRDLAGKDILEIACGRGSFACWLARRSTAPRRVIAADFSGAAVRKGRALASAQGLSARVAWEIADVTAIAHTASRFDTVICCETIEHLVHPRRAVGELARVLKPGGRLFLTTPNYLSSFGLYRAYLRVRGRRYTESGQPINKLVMLPVVQSWVKRAGLRVTAVDAIGHYLPWPGRLPIELSWLDLSRSLRFCTRWIALHSLVVAEKRMP